MVQVPNMPDRTEWPLNGQSLSISLPITDPVSHSKSKLRAYIVICNCETSTPITLLLWCVAIAILCT